MVIIKYGSDILIDILKHFVLFYFLFNIVIVILALIYDYPKELVKEKGHLVLVKALLKLLLGGVIFIMLQTIDNL